MHPFAQWILFFGELSAKATRLRGTEFRLRSPDLQRFADLGLGRYVAETDLADPSPALLKFNQDDLPPTAVTWLREHRVPLSQFGSMSPTPSHEVKENMRIAERSADKGGSSEIMSEPVLLFGSSTVVLLPALKPSADGDLRREEIQMPTE